MNQKSAQAFVFIVSGFETSALLRAGLYMNWLLTQNTKPLAGRGGCYGHRWLKLIQDFTYLSITVLLKLKVTLADIKDAIKTQFTTTCI